MQETKDAGLIPGLGKSLKGRHGNLLQCSCLENLMDRGAWWVTAQAVTWICNLLQITKELDMTYQLNNNNESVRETPLPQGCLGPFPV